MVNAQKSIEELVDREAIRDVIGRYTRGIDRRDPEEVRACYWPDAVDEHGAFSGTRDEFVNWSSERTRDWAFTMHSLGQTIIDLNGEKAVADTYFTAIHKKPKNDGWFDEMVGGRYIDLFTKRHGNWRIQHRVVAFDWFRHFADSCDWDSSPFGSPRRGVAGKNDIVYTMLQSIK